MCVCVGECVSHNNPNEIKVDIGEKLIMTQLIVNDFENLRKTMKCFKLDIFRTLEIAYMLASCIYSL